MLEKGKAANAWKRRELGVPFVRRFAEGIYDLTFQQGLKVIFKTRQGESAGEGIIRGSLGFYKAGSPFISCTSLGPGPSYL